MFELLVKTHTHRKKDKPTFFTRTKEQYSAPPIKIWGELGNVNANERNNHIQSLILVLLLIQSSNSDSTVRNAEISPNHLILCAWCCNHLAIACCNVVKNPESWLTTGYSPEIFTWKSQTARPHTKRDIVVLDLPIVINSRHNCFGVWDVNLQ